MSTPDRRPRGPARGGRELATVAALCAVGGGLVLGAAGRPWLRITAERRPPLPDVTLALSGRELAPLVAALGIVGLAGVVGLLATRRWGRLVVAALVALAGVGVLVDALTRLGPPGAAEVRDRLADADRAGGVAAEAAVSAAAVPAWPLVAALGGLLLAAGGGLALLRSRRWPTMSGRYDAPAARSSAARTGPGTGSAAGSAGTTPAAGTAGTTPAAGTAAGTAETAGAGAAERSGRASAGSSGGTGTGSSDVTGTGSAGVTPAAGTAAGTAGAGGAAAAGSSAGTGAGSADGTGGGTADRPAPAQTITSAAVWDALDRGDDPTARG